MLKRKTPATNFASFARNIPNSSIRKKPENLEDSIYKVNKKITELETADHKIDMKIKIKNEQLYLLADQIKKIADPQTISSYREISSELASAFEEKLENAKNLNKLHAISKELIGAAIRRNSLPPQSQSSQDSKSSSSSSILQAFDMQPCEKKSENLFAIPEGDEFTSDIQMTDAYLFNDRFNDSLNNSLNNPMNDSLPTDFFSQPLSPVANISPHNDLFDVPLFDGNASPSKMGFR